VLPVAEHYQAKQKIKTSGLFRGDFFDPKKRSNPEGNLAPLWKGCIKKHMKQKTQVNQGGKSTEI